MNPKQEKFCLEYAKGGNATQAYKIAYGVKNDSVAAASSARLLRNANVQGKLKELTAEVKSEKIADVREVQEILTAIARRQVKETFLSNGIEFNRPVAVKEMLKAIELLAKIQGFYNGGGANNELTDDVVIYLPAKEETP